MRALNRRKEKTMDRVIYEKIVADYSQDIYRIAVSMVHKKEDAEDILQNVFYKLLICKKEFASSEHTRRWLIRVAVNECKNHLGSAWIKRVDFWEQSSLEEHFNQELNTEPNELVKNSILMLPPKLRIVIHLFYYEEYSTKEIATILGILEATVRSRLSRGRKLIKEELDV